MTFEQQQARHVEQRAIGDALAFSAFERGETLTDAERQTLTHWMRWGSAGYPVRKLGRGWIIDHPSAKSSGIYKTKGAAVDAWEILIAKFIRLKGLEA
jgi:hypothetical protein